MADIKIPALPAATALVGDEVFELVQGGASKKATGTQLQALTGGSGNVTLNTRLNALAPRQGLVFDGVATQAPLRDAASLLQVGNVLTYVWTGNAAQQADRHVVYCKSSSATTTGSGLEIYHQQSTADVRVLLRQAGTNDAHYVIGFANAIDGQFHSFAVVIDYAGADPIITAYRDGVSLGAGTVVTAKIGSFDDTTATFARIGFGGTAQWYRGALTGFGVFNFAIPATTTSGVVGVAERYADGVWVRPSERSDVGVVTGDSVSYLAATDNGTASTTKFDFVSTATSGQQRILYSESLAVGQIVKVVLSGVSEPAGGSAIRIANSIASANLSQEINIDGDGEYVFNITTAGTGFILRVRNVATAETFTATIDSVTLLGSTLDLTPQGIGRTIIDRSLNRNHATVSGTTLPTYLQPTDGGKIVTRTNATPNQQLLALAAFDAANRYRILSWTVTALTGTPTISLGNASAGAQYVSGLALATGVPTAITLLTTIAATANLWCNSNSTDVIIHTITYERISD